MVEIIDSVSANPAIGLAILLLAIALVLSIVKKLVKLAALVLIIFGALGYFLQSGDGVPSALTESPSLDFEEAGEELQDVADTIKENLPDLERATEVVESLEEPVKVVGEALQNTASDVADKTKRLPTTLKDIMPGFKSTQPSKSNTADEESTETKKDRVKNQMLDMVKKRSSMLKARIKEAADSAKGE